MTRRASPDEPFGLLALLLVAGGQVGIPALFVGWAILLFGALRWFGMHDRDRLGFTLVGILTTIFLMVSVRASWRTWKGRRAGSRGLRLVAMAVPLLAVPGIGLGTYVGADILTTQLETWDRQAQEACAVVGAAPSTGWRQRCLAAAWQCGREAYEQDLPYDERHEARVKCVQQWRAASSDP